MNLKISGRHLEITPAINDYVKTKISRIEKYYDKIVEPHVILSIEKLNHIAEITVRIHGKDLHSSTSHENLYAAIDLLADKIERQVRKTKDRAQSHAHDSVKHQSPEPAA